MIKVINYIYFLLDLLAIDVDVAIKYKEQHYDVNLKKISPTFTVGDIRGKTIFADDLKNPYVYINLDAHSNDEEYLTITHELRHAYQLLSIREKWDDERIIKMWTDDINDYKDSNNLGYEKQSIEVDANVFTKYIIETVFKKPVDVYTTDKKLFDLFYMYIQKDFPKDEIMESFKEFNDFSV